MSAVVDKAFLNCGKKEGLEIWRIVNFQVVAWPTERYGEFFNGDSYIVLNTYKEKEGEELNYDLHFWIGQKSTQDEYGTVAIKAVELDTFLEDKPVQHRETEGHESRKFKSYFPSLIIKCGGADSGFTHVEKKEVQPRLMRVRGEKGKMKINEVPCKRSNLDSGDVFILDKGEEVHQWNGKSASAREKHAAGEFVAELKSSGKIKKFEVHDEIDMRPGDDFYDYSFPVTGPRDVPEAAKCSTKKSLYRVSDEDHQGVRASFKKEKEGKIVKGDFDSNDVFIFDAMHTVFVFKGKKCSSVEKLSAINYGEKYLKDNELKLVHLCFVNEGREGPDFLGSLDA